MKQGINVFRLAPLGVLIGAGLFSINVVYADVMDSSESGFTLKNSVLIAAPPAQVYHHLVSDIGKWWNPSHTYSGKSENLYLEDTANGCFCESLDDGGSVRHLVVVYAQPAKRLRLSGGLGPLQSIAVSGSLTLSLSEEESGCTVELTYAVAGYQPGGLQKWATPVDRVLYEQLSRLKNFVETGDPSNPSRE